MQIICINSLSICEKYIVIVLMSSTLNLILIIKIVLRLYMDFILLKQ